MLRSSVSLPLAGMLLFAPLFAGACASGGAPGRRDVGSLESELRRDPASSSIRLRLAVAYRDSGDVARTIQLLEPVVRENPEDAAATLWLGIAYEESGRSSEARHQYESFLRTTRTSSLRPRVAARIARLAVVEIRDAVRASLARERELTSSPPSPSTVGVFPFLFAGTDTTLRPLGRALAELLTTDLSQTPRLRVLERSQVQVLTDEMALSSTSYVDPATAARSGRILSAEHIVQGRVDGGPADLSIRTLVVATVSPRDTAGAAIRRQGAIQRLFDMEKQIALDIYNRIGVQLTAAERQRVDRRATSNVQALLAFGYGLEAQDAGNYAEAARQFGRAVQLDPGFQRARDLREEAVRLGAAPAGPQELARQAGNSFDLSLSAWQRARLDIEVLGSMVPNPQARDPLVEVLGTEGLGRGTGIDIIIRRPVGGQ